MILKLNKKMISVENLQIPIQFFTRSLEIHLKNTAGNFSSHTT